MRRYGQEGFLDRLVPTLVGLEPPPVGSDRKGGRRLPFRADAPVIHLVGGRGSGKSTLLGELQERYRNRVPMVRADLAAPDFGFVGLGRLPGDDAVNASHITNLLYLLASHLQLAVHGVSQPKFRRLSLGLLVVTAWPDQDTPPLPASLLEAMETFRVVITADGADRKRRKDLLKKWLDALAPVAGTALALPPGADVRVRTAATTVRDFAFAPRGDRGALDWWDDRLPEHQGDAVQKLYGFGQLFRYGGERREGIEELLVAALLADIDDSYGWARRADDTPRPLILLDNIDGLPGDRFRARLRGAFGHLKTGGRPFAHPVIVATSLGVATKEQPLTDTPGGPQERWLEMGLPVVRQKEIRAMLGVRAYPEHLPLVIDRLSGDRAGTACALLDLFEELDAPGRRPSMDAFLDRLRPETNPEFVAGLVDQLVPDPEERVRLRRLAAALDRDAAERLLASRGEDDPAEQVEQAEAELAAACWEPRTWSAAGGAAPFVADPALRTLLLLQLRAGQPAPTDWKMLHSFLRECYQRQDNQPWPSAAQTNYLHHTLALGETAQVGNALHRRFTELAPVDWLATVNVVCAAPHPPDGFVPAAPPTAPCACCTDPAADPNAATVHLAITRLLDALWQHSAPLAVPDERTINEITAELRTLCSRSGDQDGALRRARDDWPALLRQGVQAPDLPTRRRN